MYSGGLCSWAAARRIVQEHGSANVVGLFADTMIEDPDLYRFLDETSAQLGIEVVKLADGRTPWQVFIDEKFIGNSRIDPCSKILKRKLMDSWRDANCDPATTSLVFGLDWSERGRIEGSGKKQGHRKRVASLGWTPLYPMNEPPYLTKADMIADLRSLGIEPPALYAEGFPHNNCGGFCVKMGLAQARHLLEMRPETYRLHEDAEQAAMAEIGPTAKPFLRFRKDGKTRGVSMKRFRELVQRQSTMFGDLDSHGWGCGGGCAIDDDEPVTIGGAA
jgi:hypothetical protein